MSNYGALPEVATFPGHSAFQKPAGGCKATKIAMAFFSVAIVAGGVAAIVVFTRAPGSGGGGGGTPVVINLTDTLNFTALGDWGTSPDPDHQSSTQKDNCQWNQHSQWNQACWKDYNAQLNLGWLMGNWAEDKNISFVLSHGDNMYWDGVKTSVDARWNTTFEDIYNYTSLAVPWLAVMGNHDYGGGSDYAGSGAASLEILFQAQKNYKSHVPGRDWQLDHYFKRTFNHKMANGSSFDIDVFNIDTNVAETHGYNEICCQIYPLSKPWGGCNDAACRSLDTYDKTKGCTDEADIVSCREYLEKQYQDSIAGLSRDLNASTARWKIVNSHYHPRMHMPNQEDELNAVFKAGGVHAVFCGHTHAEGHDYNTETQTHFFLNGAGGGIRLSGDDGASKDTILKTFTQYAFIGVNAGVDGMIVTFWGYDLNHDGGWDDWSKIKTGKAMIYHCWNIPNDGSVGAECPAEQVAALTVEANSKKKLV